MERKNYHWIDALRGIAVVLVFNFHLIHLTNVDTKILESFLFPFKWGWIGVDLFFIISGFVISGSACHEISKNPEDKLQKNYFKKRFARIAPLYALTSLVFVIFVSHDFWGAPGKWQAWNTITHALFIHNLFPAYSGAINGSAWSLGVEMQFYFLIIFMLLWARRVNPWILLGVGLAVSIAWRFMCFRILEGRAELLVWSTTQIFGVLDAFFMGSAIFLLAADKKRGASKFIRPSLKLSTAYFLAFLLLAMVAKEIFKHHLEYWPYLGMVSLWRSLLALTFALLLLCAITLPPCKALSAALSPILYLGKISYGIYLWHMPVMLALTKTGMPNGKLQIFTVISTVALSSFSWHFFEKPLIEHYRRP